MAWLADIPRGENELGHDRPQDMGERDLEGNITTIETGKISATGRSGKCASRGRFWNDEWK